MGCLADIAKIVNTSSEVNHTELVGREDGTVLVHQYDWAEYFRPFFERQAFRGIKSLHHLVFSKATPGCATVREYSNSKEKKLSLLTSEHEHWAPSPTELPDHITPPGTI